MKLSVLIEDVIDKYFTDTVSRIGGITISDIENDVNELHSMAFDPLGLTDGADTGQQRTSQDAKRSTETSVQSTDDPSAAAVHKTWAIMIYLKSIQSWSDNETDIMNIRGTLGFQISEVRHPNR